MRKEKGITLVALVITIIILIILAGITINLSIGENGIIKRAQQAASDNNKAKLEEQLKLYQVNSYMNNEEFKDILIKNNIIDEEELENNAIVKIADNENFLAINTSEGLEEISTAVKNGDDYEGKVIYLLSDITFDNTFNIETGELLTGEVFEPIGDSNSKIGDELLEGSIKKEFNGTFNGLNHEIKNLYINENVEGNYCTGLFGYVGEKGKVENLIVTNSYISGYYETGSIVGRNRGSIVNCVNKGFISANKLTGGIAGRNCGEIKGCINYGDIYATNEQIGGIVSNCDFGDNIIVDNCKNYGNIKSTSNTIGGIVGGAYRGDKENTNVNVTITNCENYGNIGENETNYKAIGGIVGHSRGNVRNCINKGIIRGNQNIGGIVGSTNYYNSKTTLIENCYNYNSIIGNYTAVGGICGYNGGGNISKCSNSGEVSLVGENTYYGVAGIVGQGGSALCDTKIENCYNEGKIILELSNSKACQVAGIVGNIGMDTNGTYTGYIINCYNKGEINCKGLARKLNPSGIGSWGRHVVVKNCYNIGMLVSDDGTVPRGIWDSYESALESNFVNNYWLDTCGAVYGLGGVNSDVGAEPKTEEDMKKMAETLGDAYTIDTNNINGGYPVLKWQVK